MGKVLRDSRRIPLSATNARDERPSRRLSGAGELLIDAYLPMLNCWQPCSVMQIMNLCMRASPNRHPGRTAAFGSPNGTKKPQEGYPWTVLGADIVMHYHDDLSNIKPGNRPAAGLHRSRTIRPLRCLPYLLVEESCVGGMGVGVEKLCGDSRWL